MKITPYLPGMQMKKARAKFEKVKREEGITGLKKLFGHWLDLSPLESSVGRRKRVYDSTTTFLLFLLQILGGFSCADAVGLLIVSKAAKGKRGPSAKTGAYCQARKRLGIAALREISSRLVRRLTGRSDGLDTLGFEAVVADGTGEDMPDTARNRRRYPTVSEKVVGTAFPQLRFEGLFDLFSGAAPDWRYGNHHLGEQRLWKRIMLNTKWLGKLLLADAYYCSFGNMVMLIRKGAAFILPCKCNLTVIKCGGKRGDRDVMIKRPEMRAKSWNRTEWKSFPKHLRLRLIEVKIERRGFRPEKLRLLTNLRDRERYPAEKIVALQQCRWAVEIDFRAIKITMGMDHLSGKSPAMIEREILLHMIAYNLVRALMLDAACEADIPPERISFSRAVACTADMAHGVAAATNHRVVIRRLRAFYPDFLADCATQKQVDRAEPRVVKRRPKSFPRMTKARHSYPQHLRQAA